MAADIGRHVEFADVLLHQFHRRKDRAFGAAGAKAGRALRYRARRQGGGLRRLLQPQDRTTRVRAMLWSAGALYVLGEAIRIAVVVADPSWAGRSLLWFQLYIEFFAIGMAKGVAYGRRPLHAGLRTLVNGSAAAALAFLVGYALRAAFGIA